MKRQLTKRIWLTLGSVIGLGLVAFQVFANRASAPPSVGNAQVSSTRGTSTEEVTIVHEQFALHEELTREAMMAQAEGIFVGRVLEVSPTRWNQDNGSYWEGGLQLHTIEFEVTSPIIDEVGLGDQVSLTVIGPSPAEGQGEYQLAPGDRAVVFIEQRDFAWADGKRPVLTLMGVPSDSYFREQDGLYYGRPDEAPLTLDELRAAVARSRDAEP